MTAAKPAAETPSGPTSPAAPRRRGIVVLPVAIFVAMAAMFGFALMKGDPSKLPSALIGKAVPQFTLTAIEDLQDGGKPVPPLTRDLLEQGHVSFVNFWASWCVPCADEHPLLVELKARTGVAIYGVNYKDSAANARRFLGRYGNPFTAVGADGNGRAAIEWGVYGMPESFVVDGRGRIVFKKVGPISAESLKSEIIPAIEKARNAAR